MEGCLRMAPLHGTVLQIGLYGRPVPVALDTLVLKEIHLLAPSPAPPPRGPWRWTSSPAVPSAPIRW